jgi:hypothetical protein
MRPVGASLSHPCGWPLGVGFSAVPRWLPRFPALPSVPVMPLVLEQLPLPLLALWGQRHMRLLLSHTYAIHTQLLVVELADLFCAAPVKNIH